MKRTIATIILTLSVVSNLLPDTLTTEYRNPLTLVTWGTGTVENSQGDGIITSPYVDSYYNYIKYQEGLSTGTEVFTVYIYNPFTLYGDDIIFRFDF